MLGFASEPRRQGRGFLTMAGRLGADSFPTVILRKRDQPAPLTVGYSPAEPLLPWASAAALKMRK